MQGCSNPNSRPWSIIPTQVLCKKERGYDEQGSLLISTETNAYDTNGFTLITQEELGQYISDLYGFLSNEDVKLFEEDIKLLEELHDTFDWENDTLVFSYSC